MSLMIDKSEPSKKPKKEFSGDEAERCRDKALVRALGVPPRPHRSNAKTGGKEAVLKPFRAAHWAGVEITHGLTDAIGHEPSSFVVHAKHAV